MGLVIHYTHNLDPFFKGDLDGKRIFIGDHLQQKKNYLTCYTWRAIAYNGILMSCFVIWVLNCICIPMINY